NGAEALVMVEKESPDLILVDATMPKMDGFEVCAVLKSKEETRLIPVLLVTPIEETEHKIRGFEAGVDDFLHRPINSVELLARVKCLVRTKRLNDELVNVENAIIALATAIEAKDPYTEGHVERVASYALTLGKEVRLAPWELRALHKAAILHDVGKIGVDESILLKPGSLTEEEFNQLKTHTIIGERICRPLGRNRLILEVIRHHHERYDGKGYPDGLAGEDIPIAARIMAVVDAYDALTSDRPYRARRSQEQAVEILKQEAGKQFDPKIATAFISLLETGRLR
ncbi:MAG: HD domain-containing protein, partial [Chloroflexi bacterium]|nr:HD domain-containing protein [Chloroflexota bacterium]